VRFIESYFGHGVFSNATNCFAITLSLFASIAPASAEWRIETYRDQLNDRDLKFATVEAKAPDQGIVGKLEIVCRANGQLDHRVVLSTKISSGEIGGAYRIDDKATRTGSFKFYNDSTISIDEEPPVPLAGAKNYRIQLELRNGPVLVFDFDVRGVDKAINSLRCRNLGHLQPSDTVGILQS
jgi:hypothetical protein